MLNQYLCGNCIDILAYAADNTFDIVITSPPYDNIRNYEGYLYNSDKIISELYRVLKPGGTVCWVSGDQYENGDRSLTTARTFLKFKEAGFICTDIIIYHKLAVSKPVKVRYYQVWEQIGVFSKVKQKTFHPIQDRINKTAGTKYHKRRNRKTDGSFDEVIKELVTPAAGTRFNFWEQTVDDAIELFLATNEYKSVVEKPLLVTQNLLSSFYQFLMNQTNNEYYGNIMSYPTGQSAHDDNVKYHSAVFPKDLCRDLIRSYSNSGDWLLDPMCGSGTACKMAKILGLNFTGIDIAEKYINYCKKE